MEFKEIFTLLIAIYGASLSTYLAWKKRQEYSPQVNVVASEKFIIEIFLGSSTNKAILELEAKNYGEKTVVLREGGYLLPNKQKLCSFLPNTISFPFELEKERTVQLSMECYKIAHSLLENGFSGKVRLIPYFRDEIGRKVENYGLI